MYRRGRQLETKDDAGANITGNQGEAQGKTNAMQTRPGACRQAVHLLPPAERGGMPKSNGMPRFFLAFVAKKRIG